jgi:hypothetical protein
MQAQFAARYYLPYEQSLEKPAYETIPKALKLLYGLLQQMDEAGQALLHCYFLAHKELRLSSLKNLRMASRRKRFCRVAHLRCQ